MVETWGMYYKKHYGSVMYIFHSKLVRLYSRVKGTDDRKDTYYEICPFSANYESVMFYSTGPMGSIPNTTFSL